MNFKAVSLSDKNIVRLAYKLAAKNYKTVVMDFKVISPAVKIANIFVKFKKRDGVKITPLNF